MNVVSVKPLFIVIFTFSIFLLIIFLSPPYTPFSQTQIESTSGKLDIWSVKRVVEWRPCKWWLQGHLSPSTAIYSSTMLHHSASSSSSVQLGGRAIDRHNPIINDGRRVTTTTVPCTTSPINPKPYHLLHNNNKSSSNNNKSIKQSEEKLTKKKKKNSSRSDECKENSVIRKLGLIAPPPADSSRYLLSDSSFVDGLLSTDYDFINPAPMPLLLIGETKEELLDSKIVSNSNLKASSSESVPVKLSSSLSSSNRLERPSSSGQVNFCSSRLERNSSDQTPQVVVLRVSLHCKGCEGKVRKHLSKMEGVKSYNIDFAAKKVTIVGDVTPSSVLASVAKVKSAQFWPENSTLAPPSNQVIKKRPG